MNTRKLNTVDAFVVIDLPDAQQASGIVRCARKVLVDGAANLARSTTYSWALLEEQRSGASAGINAEGDAVADAIAGFADELSDEVRAGRLVLDAGKGVTSAELASLWATDGRSTLRLQSAPSGFPGAVLADELLALGALTAAEVVLGDLGGRRVVIERIGPVSEVLGLLATARGAEVVATSDSGPLATEADVLFVGSKPGLIGHEAAETLPHQAVVPIGPLPITARGLAVAGRRGIHALPDFLTGIGPLLADLATPDTTADMVVDATRGRVAELTRAALEHDAGPYLGACVRAEGFLATWQDELPFGRPIA